MQETSAAWQKGGGVAWALAIATLAALGISDSLENIKVPSVTEPGPRNSTDTMLAAKLQLPDGTVKIRALLAGTEPDQPGTTWVVYGEEDRQVQEVSFAISLLAWPHEVRIVTWRAQDGAPKMPAPPARVFFLGRPPGETVPGLQQITPVLWFKSGRSTP